MLNAKVKGARLYQCRPSEQYPSPSVVDLWHVVRSHPRNATIVPPLFLPHSQALVKVQLLKGLIEEPSKTVVKRVSASPRAWRPKGSLPLTPSCFIDPTTGHLGRRHNAWQVDRRQAEPDSLTTRMAGPTITCMHPEPTTSAGMPFTEGRPYE